MNVAVVTLAHGRHEHLTRQARSLAAGTRTPDQYVVVAMDDDVIAPCLEADGARATVVEVPRHEQGLPLARARNVGVRRALDDGAEVVVLLDVDCLAGPHLVAGYETSVQDEPQTIWSGPVTYLPPAGRSGYDVSTLPDLDAPHPARPAPPPGVLVRDADPDLFWSLSFAVSAGAWDRVGGFCEEYRGYGGEDTDFARLATARGIGLGWTGTPRAYHQYHPTSDPPVQHLEAIMRNAMLFRRRWGVWPMGGWLEAFERLGLVVRTGEGWALATSSEVAAVVSRPPSG
jgi:N-acetylglucosaminyl-diphospho-decaprenol L-rhamnosyltransferase